MIFFSNFGNLVALGRLWERFWGLWRLQAPGVAGMVSFLILAPLRNGMHKLNLNDAFKKCF
jgi:hypothetical protein